MARIPTLPGNTRPRRGRRKARTDRPMAPSVLLSCLGTLSLSLSFFPPMVAVTHSAVPFSCIAALPWQGLRLYTRRDTIPASPEPVPGLTIVDTHANAYANARGLNYIQNAAALLALTTASCVSLVTWQAFWLLCIHPSFQQQQQPQQPAVKCAPSERAYVIGNPTPAPGCSWHSASPCAKCAPSG